MVLPSIPAPSSPGLHAIAIVLAVDPVPFVAAAHVVVVYSAPRALAIVELALVDVPVAVDLDPGTRDGLLVRLGLRTGADGPEHRRRRPAAELPRMVAGKEEGRGTGEKEAEGGERK